MSDTFLYEPGTQAAEEIIRLTRENVDLRVQLANQREACAKEIDDYAQLLIEAGSGYWMIQAARNCARKVRNLESK